MKRLLLTTVALMAVSLTGCGSRVNSLSLSIETDKAADSAAKSILTVAGSNKVLPGNPGLQALYGATTQGGVETAKIVTLKKNQALEMAEGGK